MTDRIVGVVCALSSEARHLGRIHGSDSNPRPLPDGTLLVVSGMGMAAAGQAAHRLIEAGATRLASWGMAGGLAAALSPGTIFLPSELAALDEGEIAVDSAWHAELRESLSGLELSSGGTLLSSERVVASPAEKARLLESTGAFAVDMESFAVAAVARTHAIPFVAVRVVVDCAGDELPGAVARAADAQGHLRIGRLLGALLRHPGDLPRMIRLGGRYRAARRSLAEAARRGCLRSGCESRWASAGGS